MELSVDDVEAAEGAIAGSDMVLLQLESPLAAVGAALKLAKARGVITVLNPAPAQQLPADLLRNVDILVPNESETGLLTGLPVETSSQIEEAAEKLRRIGVGTVILTLGDKGAFLCSPAGNRLFPAYDIQPADTTAAGDAFVGGFAVSLAETGSFSEAVARANAAGALAATKLGAQPSLPTREEWDRFFQERS
jgi:ribokinase